MPGDLSEQAKAWYSQGKLQRALAAWRLALTRLQTSMRNGMSLLQALLMPLAIARRAVSPSHFLLHDRVAAIRYESSTCLAVGCTQESDSRG